MYLFVDSISKKIFCEFQHSTGTEETILSKQNMEREYRRSDVNIKTLRGDNSVHKTAELEKNYVIIINISHTVVLVHITKME